MNHQVKRYRLLCDMLPNVLSGRKKLKIMMDDNITILARHVVCGLDIKNSA